MFVGLDPSTVIRVPSIGGDEPDDQQDQAQAQGQGQGQGQCDGKRGASSAAAAATVPMTYEQWRYRRIKRAQDALKAASL